MLQTTYLAEHPSVYHRIIYFTMAEAGMMERVVQFFVDNEGNNIAHISSTILVCITATY